MLLMARMEILLKHYEHVAAPSCYFFAEAELARLRREVLCTPLSAVGARHLARRCLRHARALQAAIREWEGEELLALDAG